MPTFSGPEAVPLFHLIARRSRATLDDLAAHRHYSHVAIPLWNRAVDLSFFLFLSWLVGALKTAHENEIRARTERLEHDLAIARDVQTALLPPRRQDDDHYAVAAGSFLVLFTDGVTECINPKGEELGRDRVAQIVARGPAEPAGVVAELLRAVEAHAAGEPFQDDVTILCVRRR